MQKRLKFLFMFFTAALLWLPGCSKEEKPQVLAPSAPAAQDIKEEKPKENNMKNSEYPQLENTGANGARIAPPQKGEQIAVINTDFGDVYLRFFPEAAPKAVENFITHAKDGYYDGLIFHRVVEGFVIQGGDPTATGRGGESIWGGVFENETSKNVRHFLGALAMANAGPDTNGSQFYIVAGSNLQLIDLLSDPETAESLKNYNPSFTSENYPPKVLDAYKTIGGLPDLDFGYTVFGQVYDGMDAVLAIAQVDVDDYGMPLSDVVIKSVKIAEY